MTCFPYGGPPQRNSDDMGLPPAASVFPKIGQNTAVYLNDGSGCERCNFTGRFGNWIAGRWHGYPLIKCTYCGPAVDREA